MPAFQSHSVQDSRQPGLGSVSVAEGEGAQESGTVSVHREQASLSWAVITAPKIDSIIGWILTKSVGGSLTKPYDNTMEVGPSCC